MKSLIAIILLVAAGAVACNPAAGPVDLTQDTPIIYGNSATWTGDVDDAYDLDTYMGKGKQWTVDVGDGECSTLQFTMLDDYVAQIDSYDGDRLCDTVTGDVERVDESTARVAGYEIVVEDNGSVECQIMPEWVQSVTRNAIKDAMRDNANSQEDAPEPVAMEQDQYEIGPTAYHASGDESPEDEQPSEIMIQYTLPEPEVSALVVSQVESSERDIVLDEEALKLRPFEKYPLQIIGPQDIKEKPADFLR